MLIVDDSDNAIDIRTTEVQNALTLQEVWFNVHFNTNKQVKKVIQLPVHLRILLQSFCSSSERLKLSDKTTKLQP